MIKVVSHDFSHRLIFHTTKRRLQFKSVWESLDKFQGKEQRKGVGHVGIGVEKTEDKILPDHIADKSNIQSKSRTSFDGDSLDI